MEEEEEKRQQQDDEKGLGIHIFLQQDWKNRKSAASDAA